MDRRMNDLDQRSYFFDAGIRFECRRCGVCCTGDPGVVRVSEREIADIAAYLGTPVSTVVETFLYPWESGHSIKEDGCGRCLFLEDGCRIYPVRPTQCRTFPFWFANLRSEARWHEIHSQCPGIGSGHLYTKHEILKILSRSSGRPL
jgi:Fe-S-cluster containining protein